MGSSGTLRRRRKYQVAEIVSIIQSGATNDFATLGMMVEYIAYVSLMMISSTSFSVPSSLVFVLPPHVYPTRIGCRALALLLRFLDARVRVGK